MTKKITINADHLRATLREAKAQALETAAEIKADGLYGEPLHSWLYDRAAFIRATHLESHAHERLEAS